ncbi:MAG: LURP-one-related family protein [Oscillospiraceae bacterium]|nr:LURP-one-related family protein [Oscillospiraceae bacterium]
MKLYMKQKVFSWGDKFTVWDECSRERYFVEGEVFTLGKKLHILSADREELLFIHQKLLSFLPRYYIAQNGVDVAEVVKEFTFFRNRFTVAGPDWDVQGDFFAHEYEITKNGRLVAQVSKEWFTWGDAYAIEVAPAEDDLLVLSVVLVIDAVLDAQRAAASSSAN